MNARNNRRTTAVLHLNSTLRELGAVNPKDVMLTGADLVYFDSGNLNEAASLQLLADRYHIIVTRDRFYGYLTTYLARLRRGRKDQAKMSQSVFDATKRLASQLGELAVQLERDKVDKHTRHNVGLQIVDAVVRPLARRMLPTFYGPGTADRPELKELEGNLLQFGKQLVRPTTEHTPVTELLSRAITKLSAFGSQRQADDADAAELLMITVKLAIALSGRTSLPGLSAQNIGVLYLSTLLNVSEFVDAELYIAQRLDKLRDDQFEVAAVRDFNRAKKERGDDNALTGPAELWAGVVCNVVTSIAGDAIAGREQLRPQAKWLDRAAALVDDLRTRYNSFRLLPLAAAEIAIARGDGASHFAKLGVDKARAVLAMITEEDDDTDVRAAAIDALARAFPSPAAAPKT